MASYIKLKLSGLEERDVILTKTQYVNTTAATRTTDITINTTTNNTNTINVTTITTKPKGMKVKFSRNFERR
jgi:hypothetical protein